MMTTKNTNNNEVRERDISHSQLSFKDRIRKKKTALRQTTLAITAAAALGAITQQAEAALIIHNYENASFNSSALNVNPITGVLGTSGFDIFIFNASAGFSIERPFSGGNGSVSEDFLSFGTTVDSSIAFVNSGGYDTSGLGGTNQFVGFQLENQGELNDETWFGFFEVEVVNNDQGIIVSSTLDDSGAPVAIPEPSSAALGAIAFIFAASRRKRRGSS